MLWFVICIQNAEKRKQSHNWVRTRRTKTVANLYDSIMLAVAQYTFLLEKVILHSGNTLVCLGLKHCIFVASNHRQKSYFLQWAVLRWRSYCGTHPWQNIGHCCFLPYPSLLLPDLYLVGFWTVRWNRSTQRKHTNKEENMQTQHQKHSGLLCLGIKPGTSCYKVTVLATKPLCCSHNLTC